MRGRAIVMALVVLAATFAGRWIDVPRHAGLIKGDEATYVAMALSLAHDGDLKYEPRDLTRFQALYPQGPEGIFLKRTYRLNVRVQAAWPPLRLEKTAVPVTESLSYAKALAYPIVAAPFVFVGGLGGMLMLNVLMLALATWCAMRFCQERMGAWAGGILGAAFVLASVVPVFVVFLTSEIFNFTLVLVGYFLLLKTRRESFYEKGKKTPGVISAILLGVATYSKPGIVAAPLILAGFFLWPRRHFLKVASALVITVASLFVLTTLVTGEWNFQGGDRKSFYDAYPFGDASVSFDTIGGQMTTNDADTGTVFAPETLRLLPANAWYFLTGRDAGLVPFYFPGVMIAALWLLRLRQSTWLQWTIAATCAGSIAVLLIYFPFTWNGAGGPPGNRYFLAVYPTMLFLLPAGVGLVSAVTTLVVGAAFTGAMVVQPFAAASDTWRNVARAPLRWLPIELTIVDDLPVRLHRERSRIPFVHDPTVLMYHMDPSTFFAEGQAFWIEGDASTEIVFRTEQPLTRLELDVTTRVANTFTFSFGGRSGRIDLPEHGSAKIRIAPGPAMDVHHSFPYVLRLSTTAGFVPADTDSGSTDTRYLGVFVHVSFMYGPHGEPLASPLPATPGGG
jgi:hypothetical protein